MGRFAFAMTSFTAALPAALLSAVLVMAFTSQLEGIRQSIVMLLMVGITLGLSSFVVLIPFGILVFGGPKKAKTPVEKAAKKDDKKAAAKKEVEPSSSGSESIAALAIEDSESDTLATTGSAKLVDSDIVDMDDSGSSGEFDIEEMEDTSAFQTPMSGEEVDAEAVIDEDFADLGEIEEIEDEIVVEDDDEDKKPKKKRR